MAFWNLRSLPKFLGFSSWGVCVYHERPRVAIAQIVPQDFLQLTCLHDLFQRRDFGSAYLWIILNAMFTEVGVLSWFLVHKKLF